MAVNVLMDVQEMPFSDSPPGQSGLSLDPAGLTFSSQPGGGPRYTATPVDADADGDGFYGNVTGIRITLDGEMAGLFDAGVAPALRLTFPARVR